MKLNKNIQKILHTIKVVPDFPTRGISFKDITPILANNKILKITIKELAKLIRGHKFDVVVGLESRGFWLGVPLAIELGLPFVPCRKAGKLPRRTVSASYSLEYGKDKMAIHRDDIKPGSRVLIVDDIIATGGTLLAVKKMMDQLKVKASHVVVLGYLEELPEGPKKVEQSGMKVHSLLSL